MTWGSPSPAPARSDATSARLPPRPRQRQLPLPPPPGPWSSSSSSLLTEPLVVDRDDVVVAAVDTGGARAARRSCPYSHEYEWTQPYPGDEAETYGWLYVRGGRSPLPYLWRPAVPAQLVVVV